LTETLGGPEIDSATPLASILPAAGETKTLYLKVPDKTVYIRHLDSDLNPTTRKSLHTFRNDSEISQFCKSMGGVALTSVSDLDTGYTTLQQLFDGGVYVIFPYLAADVNIHSWTKKESKIQEEESRLSLPKYYGKRVTKM